MNNNQRVNSEYCHQPDDQLEISQISYKCPTEYSQDIPMKKQLPFINQLSKGSVISENNTFEQPKETSVLTQPQESIAI